MKDKLQTVQQVKIIWVFKTSVTTLSDIRTLKPMLDKLMHQGDKWNFDLEDCDHILRVETSALEAIDIIALLAKAGYNCAELEDDVPMQTTINFPDLILN